MMERLLYTLSILCLGISLCWAQGQNCPTNLGWVLFEEKCYKFYPYPRLDKNDAVHQCQYDGSTLLSINTVSEHQFIDRWLQENDEARQVWLTSGVTRADGVIWDGDGSVATSFSEWLYPEQNRFVGSIVTLDYSGTEYKWNIGLKAEEYSFICEIPINEVYRISQEFRGFDYGLDVDGPSLAPRGPSFIKEPENTVILGQTNAFHIDCVATGLPEPQYVWLRADINGVMQPIKLGDNPRYSFTAGRFTVEEPAAIDAGTYQCKTSNEYGTILSRSVTVAFGDLGEFSNVPPAPMDGIKFQGAQLECPYITGNPAISYQWYKGVYSFIRPQFQKHTFISSNGKLYFSALAPSDEDTYYCMATLTSYGDRGNYLGAYQAPSRVSLGFKLTVKSGGAFDQAPLIQNEFIYVNPSTPMTGTDINLECFAYGIGELIYSWSRKDKPLPRGHRLSSNGRILTLYDAGLEDDGVYECRVYGQMSGGEAVKSTELRMQSKPYFTYNLMNQHVDINSQLTWTCEAAGRPVPEYTWYKNGEVLRSSPGITVNKNHLTIDKLDPDRDNGMYQCGAKNRYGTTYSSGQLRVLELAPSFAKSPMLKSVTAALGGNATILCNPTAAPKPTYTWSHNDRILSPQDTRHIQLQNGNLMITNIQSSDQGTYKCKVENGIGKGAEDYSVLTTQEGVAITLPPMDDEVEMNISITLMCEASHSPNTDLVYTWMFNDHVINFEREPEFRQGSSQVSGGGRNTEGYLYIISAKFKNEGYYTCIASTGMDSASARAFIRILGPPGEPMGVVVRDQPLSTTDPDNPDKEIDLQTTRWIMWTDGDDNGGIITNYFVEFNTEYDRTWRVHPDGNDITQASTLNDNFPNKHYAMLTKLKAGTLVSFRVIARNAYGLGTPSLPTTEVRIAASPPSVKVTNVRDGQGSVGDLSIVWDPLSEEDKNGPNLVYIVGWRDYTGGSINELTKWTTQEISHERACQTIPDIRLGQIRMCKYVELVGALNYFMPYEVFVQPKNSAGPGPATEPKVIMSAEELPLGAPSNVHAYPYNSTALRVEWEPIANNREVARGRLVGYKINYWQYKSDKEIEARQNIVEIPKGQTNLAYGVIIGLEAFLWYEFNVQAYNSAGNGPKSSDYQQQTYNRAPTQYPTEVHVFSIDGFGVRVTFRGISTQWREEPLIGYVVQYWKARENMLSGQETSFGKRTTGVIRNMTSSEVYRLRVFAYSRGGQGKRSSPVVWFTVGDGEILINQETMELANGSTYLAASYITIVIIAVLTCSLGPHRRS